MKQPSAAQRWQLLFGGPPPVKSQALIAAAVAWAEQVAVHGDVAPAIQHDLTILAHQVRVARLRRQPTGAPDGVVAAVAPTPVSPAPDSASRADTPEPSASRTNCTPLSSCVTRHSAGDDEQAAVVLPLATPSPSLHPRRRGARTVAPLPTASSQLTIGARLVKLHGGQTHVVDVTADGMRYEGQLFTSLSAVAKHITGTHWNGLLFFGLRRRKVHGGARAHG